MAATPPPRALVVDWGGVLTEPLEPSLRAWAELDGLDLDTYRDVMASWLGDHQGDLATTNPIAALERGEIEVPHFEEQLAERLSARSGHLVPAAGLLQRMFDQFAGEPGMATIADSSQVRPVASWIPVVAEESGPAIEGAESKRPKNRPRVCTSTGSWKEAVAWAPPVCCT